MSERSSADYVQPLAIIPGEMWAQVGWIGEVYRNLETALLRNPHFCRGQQPLVDGPCNAYLATVDDVGAVLQSGLLCQQCALERALLAAARDGDPTREVA